MAQEKQKTTATGQSISGDVPDRYLKVALREGAVESDYRPASPAFYETGDTILVSWYPSDETWLWEQEAVKKAVPQAIQLCQMGRRALESGDNTYAATLFEQSYSVAASKGLLYVRPLINISIAYVAENDLENARAVLETLVEAAGEMEFPRTIRHMIFQNYAFASLKTALAGDADALRWLQTADTYYEKTEAVSSLSEPDYFIPWAVAKWMLAERLPQSEQVSHKRQARDLWQRALDWAEDNAQGQMALREFKNKYAELQRIEDFRVLSKESR